MRKFSEIFSKFRIMGTYKRCILKGPQEIVLHDGEETVLKGTGNTPQVRVCADFSTGYVNVVQLTDSQKTVIPERSVLLNKVSEKCLVKHRERIRLSKSIFYEVEFLPEEEPSSSAIVPTTRSLKRKSAEEARALPTSKPMDGKRSNKNVSLSNLTAFAAKLDNNDTESLITKLNVEGVLEGNWEDLRDLKVLAFRPLNVKRSPKCACFDMDGTLITTKSGKKFPEDVNDWKILYSGPVQGKLKDLFEDGFRLVVFSNQRGLATGKETKENLQRKFIEIMKKIGVPMTMYLSYGRGMYRKPCYGLWKLLEEDNGPIDKAATFYVGDAAGRPKDWELKAKRDHSKVDRLFALNFGVPFYTPEEFFLKRSRARFEMPDFDPKTLMENKVYGVVIEPVAQKGTELTTLESVISDKPELIIFVGYPASGKSTVAREMVELGGYVHVNQDLLGSVDRCIKTTKEALSNGKKVIIDNTNVMKEQRKKYIELAKNSGVRCRCFWFNCTIEQVRHNNKFRLLTGADSIHKEVNDVTLFSMRKKFQEPNASEGFDQIVSMKMVPRFDSPQHKKLFFMYLLEE